MVIGQLQSYLVPIVEAMTAGLTALRIYAISGHRLVLALTALMLGLVPVALNIYLNTQYYDASVQVILNVPMCTSSVRVSLTLINQLLFPARICPLASDAILLAVTWYKTFKVARDARTAGVQAPLAVLLLRDGTLYFITISFLNVLEIVLAFTVQLVEADAYVYVSLFVPTMSSILFTRFVFNLRQVSSDFAVSSERPLSTAPQTRTLEFSSKIVGNMDGDLDSGRYFVGDSEDEMEGELEEEITEEQFSIDLGQPDGDADIREVSV